MSKTLKATVVHVINKNNETLMGDHKKSGTLRGYGGMMEYGETWQECTCREMDDESGKKKENRINPEEEGGITIYPDKLIPVALIDYYNGDETEVPFGTPSIQVLFCITREFSGKAIQTLEMDNPYWYPFGRGHMLPFGKMAAGDNLLLDKVLADMKIKGHVRRNKEKTKVLKWKLDLCDVSDLVMLPLAEEANTPPKIYR
jgi:hypothetical protein